jgi:CSLREA domain-containing protein
MPNRTLRPALFAVLLAPGLAHGETFVVTTTTDAASADPASGLCASTLAGGDCTLRAAVQAASSLGGGPHRIELAVAGIYVLTLVGAGEDASATGDLDVGVPLDEELGPLGPAGPALDLTVTNTSGGSVVVDGNGAKGTTDRVFHLLAGNALTVSDVTIRSGNVAGPGGGILTEAGSTLRLMRVDIEDCAAEFAGGGISIDGTAELDDVGIRGNTSRPPKGSGSGGGLYNDGTTTITGGEVTGNRAQGGGISSQGGGVFNDGTLTITGTLVSDNLAEGGTFPQGGGIFNNDAITACGIRVDGNTVNHLAGFGGGSQGGGIFNNGFPATFDNARVLNNRVASPDGFLQGGGVFNNDGATFTNSTISGNSAADPSNPVGEGGGFFANDNTTLTNVTVSGNSASAEGGGIYVNDEVTLVNVTVSANSTEAEGRGGGIFVDDAVHLTNVTIAGNQALQGGGLWGDSADPARVADLRNTVLSDNIGGDCGGVQAPPVVSNGGNIASDDSCGLAGAGDREDTDARIGPLADNGGLVETHLPQAGSPAIDVVDASSCPVEDARRFSRPADGDGAGGPACDAGAVEVNGVPPVEDCANGIDDNSDCLVDCDDPLCSSDPACGVGGVVDGFFLPRRVVVSPLRVIASGIFDTGSGTVDLGAGATLDAGDLSVSVADLEPRGERFLLRAEGLTFVVRPAPTGSSKAFFRMTLEGEAAGLVDPDAPLTLRFQNAAVDGIGTVVLDGGHYRLRRVPGALLEPNLYLFRVRAQLNGSGRDSLMLRVGLATEGVTPESIPDLTIGFGEVFEVTVPGTSFQKLGDRFVFAGPPRVTLDFRREQLSLRAEGVDLGAFADGLQPLRVLVELGDDVRANDVQVVRRGKSLRY